MIFDSEGGNKGSSPSNQPVTTLSIEEGKNLFGATPILLLDDSPYVIAVRAVNLLRAGCAAVQVYLPETSPKDSDKEIQEVLEYAQLPNEVLKLHHHNKNFLLLERKPV